MTSINTNRNLYLAIAELAKAEALKSRSLEAYLRALWQLGVEAQSHATLSGADFVDLLTRAMSAHVPPFDEAWRATNAAEAGDGFAGWQAAILQQIVDLHEMTEQGTLQNEYRYFGVSAPRGAWWCNFDPATFLECATTGAYGGWEPGDDTGRMLVPGPVAVMNEAGQLELKAPDEIPSPIVRLDSITWDDFRVFLEYGQMYE